MLFNRHNKAVTVSIVILLLAGSYSIAGAHDLFLKFTSYFLQPNSRVNVSLLNGTFTQSENAVARDRMADVTVVGKGGERTHPTSDQWRDEGLYSILTFETGDAGTYVVGVSTQPNMIELSAAEFSEYLSHDGVLDILKDRRRQQITDRPANERYSKHVKAVFQVGEERTDSFKAVLGYPVEFVLLDNPYSKKTGDRIRVRFLRNGQPVAGQLLYASYDDWEESRDLHDAREAVRTFTDADGVAHITLSATGRWYIRAIHMLPTDEAGVDYVSEWATLTFEVR